MSESIYRLNCFVENKPGVLARIVGLISGRGYNIQTLNVGPTEDGTVSRMRIDVLGTEKVVNQIILQLRNCVNVIEVTSRRRLFATIAAVLTVLVAGAEELKVAVRPGEGWRGGATTYRPAPALRPQVIRASAVAPWGGSW